jgi:hypothetical protein
MKWQTWQTEVTSVISDRSFCMCLTPNLQCGRGVLNGGRGFLFWSAMAGGRCTGVTVTWLDNAVQSARLLRVSGV